MTSSRRIHSAVIAAALCACEPHAGSSPPPKENVMSERTGPLAVGLAIASAKVGRDDAIPATLTITNASDAPLVLNRRLLVAYESIVDRDVYFEVTRDGQPYAGTDEYRRSSVAKELDASFYRSVGPGEALTKQVDLHGYYRFPPGSYRIRAVYAPQKSDADRDAWSGSARSNEVTLDVK
jgi:hypothetical protein